MESIERREEVLYTSDVWCQGSCVSILEASRGHDGVSTSAGSVNICPSLCQPDCIAQQYNV